MLGQIGDSHPGHGTASCLNGRRDEASEILWGAGGFQASPITRSTSQHQPV